MTKLIRALAALAVVAAVFGGAAGALVNAHETGHASTVAKPRDVGSGWK